MQNVCERRRERREKEGSQRHTQMYYVWDGRKFTEQMPYREQNISQKNVKWVREWWNGGEIAMKRRKVAETKRITENGKQLNRLPAVCDRRKQHLLDHLASSVPSNCLHEMKQKKKKKKQFSSSHSVSQNGYCRITTTDKTGLQFCCCRNSVAYKRRTFCIGN